MPFTDITTPIVDIIQSYKCPISPMTKDFILSWGSFLYWNSSIFLINKIAIVEIRWSQHASNVFCCFFPLYLYSSNWIWRLLCPIKLVAIFCWDDYIDKYAPLWILYAYCWKMFMQYLVLAAPQITHWGLPTATTCECIGKSQTKNFNVPRWHLPCWITMG